MKDYAKDTRFRNDASGLNEFYRQNPRTESHAFRDESIQSLFNLTKIYQQIDYNTGLIQDQILTRGAFYWQDGIIDSKVLWRPDVSYEFTVEGVKMYRLYDHHITIKL